jgi:hypothetical protein
MTTPNNKDSDKNKNNSGFRNRERFTTTIKKAIVTFVLLSFVEGRRGLLEEKL